ncbi:MAG: C1 family peptidase [Aeriscardovia sp.]|nr:C1 family peptidase [Aeriscardovia sp.]
MTAINPSPRGALRPEMSDRYSNDFNAQVRYRVAANAATKNGILAAATNYQGIRELPRAFSVELQQGSITNQKHSGRCWMFSGLNTLRYEIMHKLGLDDLELSQAYLFFWDKLERSNFYLEEIINTVDAPIDDRLFQMINLDPVGDGGWWGMFRNLVKKYGVVPKSAYTESANSEDSDALDRYLGQKLRSDAAELRSRHAAGRDADGLRSLKETMLDEVYRILCISLGEPPKTFDFVARAKLDDAKDTEKDASASGTRTDGFVAGKLIEARGITPLEFMERYCPVNVDDYVDVLNTPATSAPLGHKYRLAHDGNVVGGSDMDVVNVEMDALRNGVVKQIQDGHPVWFSCDCLQFSLRKEGVFDEKTVDVQDLFDVDYPLDKGQRVDYMISSGNHAMTITGVDLDPEGRPDRWKIENSWGAEPGDKGYFVMSDSWFAQYVYDAAVRREYLDEATLAVDRQEPIEIMPWEPLYRITRCD